jgi:hypothetical protein
MKITSPNDVPSQDLTLQNSDDVAQDTAYDAQGAYLACLYDHDGFEIDGTVVPSNVSVPCHNPVLAQLDILQAGTSTEVGGDTVTTPLVLEEGKYRLVDGECRVIREVRVGSEGNGTDIQDDADSRCGNDGEEPPSSTSSDNSNDNLYGIIAMAALLIMTAIVVAVGLREVLAE